MLTRPKLKLFASVLMLSTLSACLGKTTGGAATEATCAAWLRSLPTSSQADTEQTAMEIDRAHRVQEAACS